jgi:pantetheine-phosphate adenylyltransferase
MKERTAVYPGSFDPVTLGHLDLIRRGLRLFDCLVIGVGVNSRKQPLFDVQSRVDMVYQATLEIADIRDNQIRVYPFDGMLGEFAAAHHASIVLRGMRTLNDFDYEFQMAYANQALYPDLDTVFVATDPKYSGVSSSVVREVLARTAVKGPARTTYLDATLGHFVPATVIAWMRDNHVKFTVPQ